MTTRVLTFLTCILCSWAWHGSLAEKPPEIGELGKVDLAYMTQQRTNIGDLVLNQYGSRFKGQTDTDLALLQRLLDERLVRNNQTKELQAMGIILGDLLATDLDMDWVVYEDKLGRSRALRYKQTDSYLFPITMISRRREVDNLDPVIEIYRKAYDSIDATREKLPFQ